MKRELQPDDGHLRYLELLLSCHPYESEMFTMRHLDSFSCFISDCVRHITIVLLCFVLFFLHN